VSVSECGKRMANKSPPPHTPLTNPSAATASRNRPRMRLPSPPPVFVVFPILLYQMRAQTAPDVIIQPDLAYLAWPT
jgi:hypothetical protein